MHGDLYAHNILVDDQGNALLGDFGAASVYDRSDTHLAFALERIEISAFGCLLDDLLQLCSNEHQIDIKAQLTNLKDECMAEDVNVRPDFEYVCSVLNGI
jgi:serine/threonine protein kinase